MADRNPFIPSERRKDVESRTQINEDEANRRFAEKQAKLQKEADNIAAQQAAANEAREKKDDSEV